GCLAYQPALPRQAAALDADVGEQAVDQRRLDAVAERGVDDLVSRAPVPAAIPAGDPIELHDADVLDLLERLDGGRDDPLDMLEQLAPEEAGARRVGQHVLGLVQ